MSVENRKGKLTDPGNMMCYPMTIGNTSAVMCQEKGCKFYKATKGGLASETKPQVRGTFENALSSNPLDRVSKPVIILGCTNIRQVHISRIIYDGGECSGLKRK